jgi:hypothetical protein
MSADQTCGFFTQQSFGASQTGTCTFTYDNRAPFFMTTTINPVSGPINSFSTITLVLSEEMRNASVTTPQSISLTDGINTIIFTNGVNATFTRTANVGSATWVVVPTVNTSVTLPATITGASNLRDWAGNFAQLAGDLFLP